MSETTELTTKMHHFFRNEIVYGKSESDSSYTDVGVKTPVECWECDTCRCRVTGDSKFCPNCHRKFVGILENNTAVCKICNAEFKFEMTDNDTPLYCNDCSSILGKNQFASDIAKAFYNRGYKNAQTDFRETEAENVMNNSVIERILISDADYEHTNKYSVTMSKPYTVGEFISMILSSYGNEWGCFSICKPFTSRSFERPSCNYKYGYLESSFPDNTLNKIVKSIIAEGSGCNMDYTIMLNE